MPNRTLDSLHPTTALFPDLITSLPKSAKADTLDFGPLAQQLQHFSNNSFTTAHHHQRRWAVSQSRLGTDRRQTMGLLDAFVDDGIALPTCENVIVLPQKNSA